MLCERPLGGVDQRLGMVARLDQLLLALVLGRMRLGILDHLLDVGVREAARGLDADLLLLARRLVLGRDIDDAVGVDVEGDLDLAKITVAIGTINVWNRIAVGFRSQHPIDKPAKAA